MVFQWRLYRCKAEYDGNIVVTIIKNNDIKFLYSKDSYDDLIKEPKIDLLVDATGGKICKNYANHKEKNIY